MAHFIGKFKHGFVSLVIYVENKKL